MSDFAFGFRAWLGKVAADVLVGVVIVLVALVIRWWLDRDAPKERP